MKFLGMFKGVTKDLIYSMLGLVVMHGVIQFILYPTLNGGMGQERFGTVLTLISLISIMSATFGTAANYSRMVSVQRGRKVKGDYNIFLAGVLCLAVPVSLMGCYWLGEGNAWHYVGYFLLMAVTILRYYSDVEFRLNINYKHFFLYYLLISLGYLVGTLFFKTGGCWAIAMLLGEGLAVLFVVVKGHIFKGGLFLKSCDFNLNLKSFMVLSGTEIIATLVLNSDRLMLKGLVGSGAVTTFYVATLIGKTMALVTVPFNGVLIGHLNRYKGSIKGNIMIKLAAAGVALSLLLGLVCTGVSDIFVKVMYPDVYDAAREYFFIANVGQILYFISSALTVVLLRFTEEKYQLYINMAYLVVFLAIAVPMTLALGVSGMAWALIIVNFIRIMSVALVGKVVIDRKGNG